MTSLYLLDPLTGDGSSNQPLRFKSNAENILSLGQSYVQGSTLGGNLTPWISDYYWSSTTSLESENRRFISPFVTHIFRIKYQQVYLSDTIVDIIRIANHNDSIEFPGNSTGPYNWTTPTSSYSVGTMEYHLDPPIPANTPFRVLMQTNNTNYKVFVTYYSVSLIDPYSSTITRAGL